MFLMYCVNDINVFFYFGGDDTPILEYLSELSMSVCVQFKSVSQRLEEVEIDVFRSLDKVKDEPSPGSTFFKDCLVEWRV